MASWREIEAIKRDRAEAHRVIANVMALGGDVLSDWETEFGGDLGDWLNDRDLTTPQAEKLLQIRNQRQLVRTFDGFNIGSLIQQCYEARLDLNERDEERITRLRAISPDAISRERLPWLLYCARQLELIDEWLVDDL
jgi:hypothetical protein